VPGSGGELFGSNQQRHDIFELCRVKNDVRELRYERRGANCRRNINIFYIIIKLEYNKSVKKYFRTDRANGRDDKNLQFDESTIGFHQAVQTHVTDRQAEHGRLST